MVGRAVAGLVIIGVGLLLVLLGSVAAWKEAKQAGLLGEPSDFVSALASLVTALGKARTSVVYFAFGTLLIFLGGVFLGVSELVA
jgi:hypothetical protein